MADHPILQALDNPEEAAYRAERRRGRRRQILVVLVAIGLVLCFVGWKVIRHVVASAWLMANQHKVEWSGDGKSWKWGGTTSVSFAAQWSISDDAHREADLRHITWLHHVHDLDLSGAVGLTDDEAAILDQLTSLKSLNLDRTRKLGWAMTPNPSHLTDFILFRIQRLKELESLDLSGHAITDAGLFYLKGLSQLSDLSLRETEITDAGLEHLKGLPRLKTLDVIGTKVSPQAIQKFAAARPEVKILSDVEVNTPTEPLVPHR
jgi:hypothetical protein